MTQTDFRDEDLTAFLDGETDATTTTAIEAALERDPLLAARLAALDVPLDRLRDAGGILMGAAPAYAAPSPSASSTSGWRVAAGLAIGVVLGAGAMHMLAPKQDWVAAVASYQALYVPETLAGSVQPEATTRAVISAFEAKTGVSLNGVTDVAGLTFKRAQTLGLDGNTLLQLAYVTPDGTPVAYCITTVTDADRLAKATQSHGLNTIHWVRGGAGFVLVGDLDMPRLAALQGILPGA